MGNVTYSCFLKGKYRREKHGCLAEGQQTVPVRRRRMDAQKNQVIKEIQEK